MLLFLTKLGPITHIDWIEEVIPVFGKILISQTDTVTKSKSSCSTFANIIMGCAGLFLITVTIRKSKYTKDIEKKEVFLDEVDITKISKQEETEKKEIFIDQVIRCKFPQDRQVEIKEHSLDEGNIHKLSQAQEKNKVIIHHETEPLNSNKQSVENREKNQEQNFQEENTLKEEIKVSIQHKTDILYSNQETVENDEQIEETKVPVNNTLKEKIEVSFQNEIGSVSTNQEYSVQLGNFLSKKTGEFDRIEHSKREWCYYQEFELEDVDWIRKIKTFKITKVFFP